MNWEIRKLELVGASDIPREDQPIIDAEIKKFLEKFKQIEENWWREKQLENLENKVITFYDHIAVCVDIQEESKIAFISEDHPNWNPNNQVNYSGTIEICDWEIHYDFNVQQGCVNILFDEFQKFISDIRKTIEKLIQLNQIKEYLTKNGGWKLYKFNESDKFKDSYEFYCYRIRDSKPTWKAGYVKFKLNKPNIWLFTDLNNFLKIKYGEVE